MGKWFVFITIRAENSPLPVWYSHDILKATGFIKSLIAIKDPHRMVYIETADNEIDVRQRFNELKNMGTEKKMELIKMQNPDMITLIPGINIDL